MIRAAFVISVPLVLASAASALSAETTLTFEGRFCVGGDGTCVNGSAILQTYGDGPGVDVEYDGNTATSGLDPLTHWGEGYGGTQDIAYAVADKTGSIFLKPLQGALITLKSFMLATYAVDRMSQFTILDGLGNVLASVARLNVPYAEPFQFSRPLSSDTGIRIEFGPEAYNVGIDEIVFETTIPVPLDPAGTGLLGLMAMAGLMAHARRGKADAADHG